MAFVLFHVSEPAAALREVHRGLRPGGGVGLTTWGRDAVVPGLEVWDEELDRHGAPPETALIARHELMDTPDKLRMMLERAGFHAPRAECMPWSHQPSLDEFVAEQTTLGVAGRRLAGLEPAARTDFLRHVRARLENLSFEHFVDRSEVIAATAMAARASRTSARTRTSSSPSGHATPARGTA